MNPFLVLLPVIIEAVKMIEAKVRGKGKGKLKKKKVVTMVMDSVEAAVASKQLDLGGLPFAAVKPLIGTGIDLAVTMLNKTGVFQK